MFYVYFLSVHNINYNATLNYSLNCEKEEDDEVYLPTYHLSIKEIQKCIKYKMMLNILLHLFSFPKKKKHDVTF